MWGLLGFVGLLFLTDYLLATGIYKHFVLACIALIAIGVIFNFVALYCTVGTFLLCTFFALALLGCSGGEYYEPHGRMDWRD